MLRIQLRKPFGRTTFSAKNCRRCATKYKPLKIKHQPFDVCFSFFEIYQKSDFQSGCLQVVE
jgi:hypothetical protein